MAHGLKAADSGFGQAQIFYVARFDDRAASCARLSLANDCTDAELIGAAWRRWGLAFADHLLGDFAIILHDRATGQIHAVRDHIGACPLFYRLRKGCIEFSATIEPLIGEGEGLEFDPSHIAAAVLGGHRSAPDSIFYRAAPPASISAWWTLRVDWSPAASMQLSRTSPAISSFCPIRVTASNALPSR